MHRVALIKVEIVQHQIPGISSVNLMKDMYHEHMASVVVFWRALTYK